MPGELPRVSSRAIAAGLREAIERGEYAPGQRLPSILRLSEACGTDTRTAARALQLLAGAGHAEHRPGVGWFAPG